jgi:UDP-N-acetyl-D-glucosamine dehydrogenase
MTDAPLPPAAAELSHRIADRSARVAIVGLGYAGLPLAEAFVITGFPVLGYDIDVQKVLSLGRGESYLGHIASERVAALRATGRFEATADAARLGEADALLLCVPTPLTDAREPDLSYVTAAATAVAHRLRPGRLVVLESTTYPGTTRDVVRPILEGGGLRCGTDFFLAYCPEREDPGNRQHTTATIPRVVGGLDAVSGGLAAGLYGCVVRVVAVSSAEVAEACKILENTYRAVNIALVNELKMLYDAMGIDVWEVIEAAKTKPFGFQAFYPGPGLGGHCIPIDPFYLAWVARKYDRPARFIKLAGEINTAMPAYVLDKVIDALNERGKAVKGSRVLVLGVSYKKDLDDTRESPGVELLGMLRSKGSEVCYNDPHVPQLPALDLASQPLTEELLRGQDCVLIVTDHSAYDWAWVVEHSAQVVDTRNATHAVTLHGERIVKA